MKEAQFPVVVKGSLGGVDNLRYCNTFNQLRKAMLHLFNYEEKLICQEYVVGTGHGFYCNYNKGKLDHFFMHKRIKEFPVTGGSSAVARSYFDDKLMDKGKLLLDNLEWNGPAMIEFKHDSRTNEYKLIEINPKLWGSLDLTISSGVDMPLILVNQCLDLGTIEKKPYKDLTYRWFFPDEALQWVASGFKSKILKRSIVANNIDKTDLSPTIFQIGLFFTKFISLLIRSKFKSPSGLPQFI